MKTNEIINKKPAKREPVKKIKVNSSSTFLFFIIIIVLYLIVNPLTLLNKN